MSEAENSKIVKFQLELDHAKTYAEIWDVVKNTAEMTLGKHRVGMMLFLDDLPLQLGAYHPAGTNNVVLNRSLVKWWKPPRNPNPSSTL